MNNNIISTHNFSLFPQIDHLTRMALNNLNFSFFPQIDHLTRMALKMELSALTTYAELPTMRLGLFSLHKRICEFLTEREAQYSKFQNKRNDSISKYTSKSCRFRCILRSISALCKSFWKWILNRFAYFVQQGMGLVAS
jgi:hypothetical protein